MNVMSHYISLESKSCAFRTQITLKNPYFELEENINEFLSYQVNKS